MFIVLFRKQSCLATNPRFCCISTHILHWNPICLECSLTKSILDPVVKNVGRLSEDPLTSLSMAHTIESSAAMEHRPSVVKVNSAGSDCRNRTEGRWDFTRYGATMFHSGRQQLPLRVLSYNVLAQGLLDEHPHLYRNCSPRHLDWKSRWKLILQEITTFNADIICLQEVQKSHVENYYMKEFSELGYEGIFKKRTNRRVDGVGLWFRRSLLRCDRWSAVEFRVPREPLLDRDNVALVARLVPVTPGWEHWALVVATTHLLFNMWRHDVKLAQTQLLLAEVEALAYRGDAASRSDSGPRYWPLIVTGDLNTKPGSGVYSLLSDGRLEYEGRCARTLEPLGADGGGHRLGKRFLSPALGVTDSCQYASEIISRLQVEAGVNLGHCVAPTIEETLQKIASCCPALKDHPDIAELRFGTGILTHRLNLQSVYTHGKLGTGEEEVTSTQENGSTVDYIFYSTSEDSKEESNLKLVASYRLFTRDEARRVGPTPNAEHPSDHYPLVARFALVP